MPRNYDGPGRYRHHKGSEYEVLGLALREDSLDKADDPKGGETFVIYRPLTPGSLLERRAEDFWARELGDFDAAVPGRGPRFRKLEPTQYAHVGEPFESSVHGCARCGGAHVAVEWLPLTNPIEDSDGSLWTHWALCRTTSEPILMRSVEKGE